jgi:hypothetical protein
MRCRYPGSHSCHVGIWSNSGFPDTGIVAVECCPIFEIPLDHSPIKCPGIPQQVINIRLFIFPELGRSMMAYRVNAAVGVDHRDCLA